VAPIRGITIAPSLSYYSRKITETSALVGEVSTLIVDSKFGYAFNSGLFVGVQANYETGKSGNDDVSGYSAGPTVGYSDDYTGIFVTATYHLVGKMDYGVAGKYDKVRGLQIDLAYPLAITDKIRFGPQLSWKSLKYSDGGALDDADAKGVVPSATLWINF
jgi:hypothetical protein